MDDQNRNLILASVLSFLVIVVWFIFFPPPEPSEVPSQETAETTATTQNSTLPIVEQSSTVSTGTTVSAAEGAPRIAIETKKLSGTISLKGGRLDDLSLLGYKVDLNEVADNVTLLRPVGQEGA